MQQRIQQRRQGFTLLEVMVALLVVALGLGAAISAVTGVAETGVVLRTNMLATWVAENRLVQIRLAHEFPPTGERSNDCVQGEMKFICKEAVIATPNPNFRRVEVSVHDASNPQRRITKLVQLVTNG